MSISTEDFLKNLYYLKVDGDEKASSTKLAKRLGVSNAAITDMARKLGKEGMVNYQKYRGIVLTEKGEKLALRVIRKHRLWETFLHEVLGLTWEEVHTEAENLEHQSSDLLAKKIDAYLGYPDFDLHGDPIPDINGKMKEDKDAIPLMKGEIGKSYKIKTISHRDAETVKYYVDIGLATEKKIILKEKLDRIEAISLEVDGKLVVINNSVARHIKVKEYKNKKTDNYGPGRW